VSAIGSTEAEDGFLDRDDMSATLAEAEDEFKTGTICPRSGRPKPKMVYRPGRFVRDLGRSRRWVLRPGRYVLGLVRVAFRRRHCEDDADKMSRRPKCSVLVLSSDSTSTEPEGFESNTAVSMLLSFQCCGRLMKKERKEERIERVEEV